MAQQPRTGSLTDNLRSSFKEKYQQFDHTEEREILGNSPDAIPTGQPQPSQSQQASAQASQAPLSHQEQMAKRRQMRKTNEGIKPHRCDARLEEWLQGTVKTLSPVVSWRLMGTFLDCMKSEPGKEPQDPYVYMDDEQVEFYESLAKEKRIRESFAHGASSAYDRSNPHDVNYTGSFRKGRDQSFDAAQQQQSQQDQQPRE